MLVANKDRERARRRQTSVTTYMSKITVEDIYTWIAKAYREMINSIYLITRAFCYAGLIESNLELNSSNTDIEAEDQVDVVPHDAIPFEEESEYDDEDQDRNTGHVSLAGEHAEDTMDEEKCNLLNETTSYPDFPLFKSNQEVIRLIYCTNFYILR